MPFEETVSTWDPGLLGWLVTLSCSLQSHLDRFDEVFADFDRNGDGVLGVEELKVSPPCYTWRTAPLRDRAEGHGGRRGEISS